MLLAHVSHSQANTKLSNLVSPTAVNQHLLPNTTYTKDLGSATLSWRNIYLRGDLYLDGTRFVSNAPGTQAFNAFLGSYSGQAITSGTYNAGIGHNALLKTTSGSNNAALGANALYNNTTGSYNTAVGRGTLYYNTSGSSNTANGSRCMNVNTTGGYNTAMGFESLYNSTGSYNVGIGFQTLYYNQNNYNTATGSYALYNNTSGGFNKADGFAALYLTTTGSYNTGSGSYALYSNTSGYGNTALGYFADVSSSGLTNATAIGYNAIATASNQVMLGSASVTAVVAAGGYYLYSDGRFKSDIKADVPGLDFINALKPVTYHYNVHGLNAYLTPANKAATRIGENGGNMKTAAASQAEEQAMKAKEQKLYTGFVAQDVEAAAQKLNYDFSGIHKPAGDKDVYSLSYADFVVPLVKAVQELNQKTEEENKQLKSEIADLRKMILELKNNAAGSGTLTSASAYLEQNSPNPVAGSTIIRYTIPVSAGAAFLHVTDAKGQLVKTITLSNKGTGQVTLNSGTLAAGTYNYTLIVDGKQADTKRFIITR